eukprot:TRINITY_DN957_c0_g1_i1.p1 TRINITY_DN957_c0_g1~~TRINITY_DN957_c0_g1_i1.p1  ORF type:complete len:263 (+),score=87.15 TRINITY_DN957_c0_g1_i1:28-789(+)
MHRHLNYDAPLLDPLMVRQKPTYTSYQSAQLPQRTRTTDPITTGTSVLALRCNDFVMLASDTCVSYGSLSRFRSVERLKTLGKFTILGASGEYSDFQFMMDHLNQLILKDSLNDDSISLSPSSIHSYLTRVMYNKRNKFDPWYNQVVLGGYKDGKSFLGMVDMVATNFEDATIATGYGEYIALPLLRKAHRPDMTQDEAKALLEECMRVLFYRDARTINKIQIATVSAEGHSVTEPYSLSTYWEHGEKGKVEQ